MKEILSKLENPYCRRIVETAEQLFLKHGIRRIPIEEICRVADVSKMTFYKFFANKEDLLKFLLTYWNQQSLSEFEEIMSQPISFPEKIKRLIAWQQKKVEAFSPEFHKDAHEYASPEIKETFEKYQKEFSQTILDHFLKAQARGDIRQGIKTEFLLYFIHHMFDMMHDEKLASLYENPKELFNEIVQFFFYGILPPPVEKEEKNNEHS